MVAQQRSSRQCKWTVRFTIDLGSRGKRAYNIPNDNKYMPHYAKWKKSNTRLFTVWLQSSVTESWWGCLGPRSLGSGLIVKDSRELLRVMELTVLDLVCGGGYMIVYNYVLYHLNKAEKRNPAKQKMPQWWQVSNNNTAWESQKYTQHRTIQNPVGVPPTQPQVQSSYSVNG